MLISLHTDAIGLYKLGKSVEDSLLKFENILKSQSAQNDITFLIPSYSYSYTDKRIYDVRNSNSKVGRVSEFLRKGNFSLRSSDPIFSYLIFGNNNFGNNFSDIKNVNCFGNNSIFSEMFEENALIGSLGAPFERSLTCIHYIEKLLEVSYREDKHFLGQTVSLDTKKIKTTATFFCRKIELGFKSDFSNLVLDLKNNNLFKNISFNDIIISYIKFQDLYDFVEKKIKEDYYYLCKMIQI